MHYLYQRSVVLIVALSLFVVACVTQGPGSGSLHRWWSGLGPILPHSSFPADCSLCHVGSKWNSLREDFEFDHELRTGVRLDGAHKRARCLRCHNDRGPVATFKAKGCVGCHGDRHAGELGTNCASCHEQNTWRAVGQVEKHNNTRFPLTGAHLGAACHRCHPGGWVGNFVPTDTECLTCHTADLARAINPPHIGLGWVSNCNRCHMPTRWKQATIR